MTNQVWKSSLERKYQLQLQINTAKTVSKIPYHIVEYSVFEATDVFNLQQGESSRHFFCLPLNCRQLGC